MSIIERKIEKKVLGQESRAKIYQAAQRMISKLDKVTGETVSRPRIYVEE